MERDNAHVRSGISMFIASFITNSWSILRSFEYMSRVTFSPNPTAIQKKEQRQDKQSFSKHTDAIQNFSTAYTLRVPFRRVALINTKPLNNHLIVPRYIGHKFSDRPSAPSSPPIFLSSPSRIFNMSLTLSAPSSITCVVLQVGERRFTTRASHSMTDPHSSPRYSLTAA